MSGAAGARKHSLCAGRIQLRSVRGRRIVCAEEKATQNTRGVAWLEANHLNVAPWNLALDPWIALASTWNRARTVRDHPVWGKRVGTRIAEEEGGWG
jgi:hypothetical protein